MSLNTSSIAFSSGRRKAPLCCTEDVQVLVQFTGFGEKVIHCEPSSDRTTPSVCSTKLTQAVNFISIRKVVILMTGAAPTINMTATGANIKNLIKAKGLKIVDIQNGCGFSTPQAVFKWMRGDAMPSIDNMVILAHMLDVTIDQIIILN